MELAGISPTAERIIGGIVGTAIGLTMTYLNIKNAKGPREKAFAIRIALIYWTAIALLVVLPFLLPTPIYYWTPFWIALALAAKYLYRKQREIRAEEEITT